MPRCPMPDGGGLRERKKRETRERIAAVALELFDRHGFHETTIPTIAAAADVAPRTVSVYFPIKEDLAFPETAVSFGRLAARLGDRRSDETTAEALRDWIGTELPAWEALDPEDARRQRRVVQASEALRAHKYRLMADVEEILTEAIAADLEASPQDLEPRMAAAATMAIFGVLGMDSDASTPTEPPVPERRAQVLELLDRALLFVGAGIRALQDGTSPPPTSAAATRPPRTGPTRAAESPA